MSGIYIHIPFCKSKCHYCDFYSITGNHDQNGFVGALLAEMTFRKDYLPDERVDTIYFGGGTPTLLSPVHLGEILKRLKELFEVDPDAEITLEANPDDLNTGFLKLCLKAGFNRISIGTQSFFDEHLKMMNRRHNAAQAAAAVKMASVCGFDSISLDLIYGIPGMTPDQWEHNLHVAADLPVDHISAYHLTIEQRTRFGKLKKSGLFTEISGEESVGQYLLLLKILGDSGFEQYEISNFARNERYSRHNSKYWYGESYLGLGPSAHSFNGTGRQWNPSSLARYLADVKGLKPPAGESIDPAMKRNEYVMTRLRTARGIESPDFIRNFGEPAWQELLCMTEKHRMRGHLLLENDRLRFNREAWFQSDGILSDLFIVR